MEKFFKVKQEFPWIRPVFTEL